MALLSCIIYNEYFYFIGYWLGEVIRSFVELLVAEKPANNVNYDKKEDFIVEEELLKLILLNIADLLTGFLVLYTKRKMRFSSERSHKKEKQNLIYTDTSRFKHKICLIPLISLLDLTASSVYLIGALFSNIILLPRQLDWMLAVDIIARIIFSIIILKINVRKHHKLGIILCVFGFILMSFSDIISIKNEGFNFFDIFIFLIIIFPKAIIFPLVDVLNKIVLTNDFLLPHSLMFYRGLSQCGFFFIITPILNWKNKINWNFLLKFTNYKRIIYIIFFTLISCVRNLCVLKVIYIFNSHYVSFLLAIIIFENTIRQFLEDKLYNLKQIQSIVYFIADIIALILISFGTLIFNEMVIINACGLNTKTKPGLLVQEQYEDKIDFESVYYEEEEDEDNHSENQNHINDVSADGNNENENHTNDKAPDNNNINNEEERYNLKGEDNKNGNKE